MAAFRARAGAIDIDSETRVVAPVRFQLLPSAGGERQAVAVVDAAFRDPADDLGEARIVLVAVRSIGLNDQCARAHGGAAAHDLNVGRLRKDYRGQHPQYNAPSFQLHSKRRIALRRGGSPRYREKDGEHQKIGQHGSAAITQEGRHHARKRHYAKRSSADEEKRQGGGRGETSCKEKLVIAFGGEGDAEGTVQQDRVEREDREQAEKTPLFTKSRQRSEEHTSELQS